jgi:hypothetical protein
MQVVKFSQSDWFKKSHGVGLTLNNDWLPKFSFPCVIEQLTVWVRWFSTSNFFIINGSGPTFSLRLILLKTE